MILFATEQLFSGTQRKPNKTSGWLPAFFPPTNLFKTRQKNFKKTSIALKIVSFNMHFEANLTSFAIKKEFQVLFEILKKSVAKKRCFLKYYYCSLNLLQICYILVEKNKARILQSY